MTTAKEAREFYEIVRKGRSIEKSELEKILLLIMTAALNGDNFLVVSGYLSHDTTIKLESLGYEIVIHRVSGNKFATIYF